MNLPILAILSALVLILAYLAGKRFDALEENTAQLWDAITEIAKQADKSGIQIKLHKPTERIRARRSRGA